MNPMFPLIAPMLLLWVIWTPWLPISWETV
jgi:hypothetical protein